LIEKHVDGSEGSESEPVFSTEHLDAFLMRAPKGFDGATHLAVLDTYIFFERGDEYYCPMCTVHVQQCQHEDGTVLNCVMKCDLGPFRFTPSVLPSWVHSHPAFMKEIESELRRNATESLLGIQEFAGPVTLEYMEIRDFQGDNVSEALYYELNGLLKHAAIAGNPELKLAP
jgi:hypothetical protein